MSVRVQTHVIRTFAFDYSPETVKGGEIPLDRSWSANARETGFWEMTDEISLPRHFRVPAAGFISL